MNYQRVSLKPLGNNTKYRAKEVIDLEKKGLIHVSAITQRAMWVFKGKSTDKKLHKEKRKKILDVFASYCSHIFIDEAQDIDKDTRKILEVLDSVGIDITLVGDPKQDLRGFGNLRELLKNENVVVEYKNQCYRCPEKHLKISNKLVDENEVQSSGITEGKVQICFETSIADMNEYIESGNFDLVYIYKKNDRFNTHVANRKEIFDQLFDLMLEFIPKYYQGSNLELQRLSFMAAQRFIDGIEHGRPPSNIVREVFKGDIEKKEYAQIASLMNNFQPNVANVLVSSIESIKGQEGDNCLFILSKDLAPYLFLDRKDDNKMKAALYVALTRSRKDLTILLTREAEKKYPKDFVKKKFCQLFNEKQFKIEIRDDKEVLFTICRD